MKRLFAAAMVLVMLATGMGVGWAETDTKQEESKWQNLMPFTEFMERYCKIRDVVFGDKAAIEISFTCGHSDIVMEAIIENEQAHCWFTTRLPEETLLNWVFWFAPGAKDEVMPFLYACNGDIMIDDNFGAWYGEHAQKDFDILTAVKGIEILTTPEWGRYKVYSKVNENNQYSRINEGWYCITGIDIE